MDRRILFLPAGRHGSAGGPGRHPAEILARPRRRGDSRLSGRLWNSRARRGSARPLGFPAFDWRNVPDRSLE